MTTVIEQCAAAALAALTPDVAQHFADDPMAALRDDLKLTVRGVDHLDETRTDGGVCDGISYLSDGVILYRPTGNRRENFTLAHELGHWLVDQVDDVYDKLSAFDDAAKMLEMVCDRVARLILLPDDRVAAVLDAAPVEAKHVAALYDATSASLHACTIALKDRLPGLGAVVAIDPGTEQVAYASIRPDDDRGWPVVYPWPGQTIPPGHPLRGIQPGGKLRRRTFWQTPWGTRGEFYIDAVADARRTIAVFSAEDLWHAERFHPAIQTDFDQRPVREVRCCGGAYQVRGWPCTTCGGGYCPKCGNCRCSRQDAAAVLCTGCYMKYLPHLLVDGLCEECR